MAIKYYNNDCTFILKEKRRCTSWLKECAHNEGFKVGDISYIFCSSESHIEINRQYLGHDYYTDIITFDETEYPSDKIKIGTLNGDLFIDTTTVKLNAKEFNSDPKKELHRVIVHGLLHLCGLKDKTAKETKEMRSKEDYYLDIFFKDQESKV